MTEYATAENIAVQTIGPGGRLRLARESHGLSIKDISNLLHLKPQTIIDIENDCYDENIDHVYHKGYLRAYANLLRLSGDEVIVGFYQLLGEEPMSTSVAEPAPDAIPVKTKIRERKPRPMRLVLWGVVLIAVVAIAALWTEHPEYFNTKMQALTHRQEQATQQKTPVLKTANQTKQTFHIVAPPKMEQPKRQTQLTEKK